MANSYVLPFQMPGQGGGCGCSGDACGDGDGDGGGGGGCGYCYPGDQSPLPSPTNPWAFCVTSYPEYSD
jgi:hypothetical protein